MRKGLELTNIPKEFIQWKSFVIGVRGDGKGVSGIIQKASDSNIIPEKKRWSHVLMGGRDKLGQLVFIQSHFKTGGVKALSFQGVLDTNRDAIEIVAYEYPHFNIDEALIYARLEIKYGSVDIIANANNYLASLLPDSPGVICSECNAENDNGYIQGFIKKERKIELPDHLVKPVHYHEYMIQNNLNRAKIL